MVAYKEEHIHDRYRLKIPQGFSIFQYSEYPDRVDYQLHAGGLLFKNYRHSEANAYLEAYSQLFAKKLQEHFGNQITFISESDDKGTREYDSSEFRRHITVKFSERNREAFQIAAAKILPHSNPHQISLGQVIKKIHEDTLTEMPEPELHTLSGKVEKRNTQDEVKPSHIDRLGSPRGMNPGAQGEKY